ncbi:MAG TPA: hypothetical protein DCW74_00330 [Alteromonas australica]|jgi:hypothetical protein|uniref:Uncharacterized protein n=1 Tax=Alteromonas australica TaxID=589873 RepID=A0A358E343_9ALTE|nr:MULTISPECIES: hypothetical protein [Alteromonas]MAF69680.1 hypothetical protein [Alteromonas sp.]MAO31265.1 hypothetical protein [Alteromonas sp.]MBU32814.1 hypothetical protein [Alteromonas sp.]QPL51355.1 hypothetical protein IUA53_07050 [Alteromonas sp. B31-7]HAI73717.1 hypothetical protein [Alteromonas australica]|tara:strand:- start:2804 stop:3529 length:726 start_codon:yes stop_codon:yes gene_type:complete
MSDKYKSSPFFGWLTAGADLITAQLESAANTVSQRLDDTHEAFESMQVKGKQVETELKQTWHPATVIDSAQQLVSTLPVVSMLFGNKRQTNRELQLDALSAKVDLLVEQVAILAAKQAAEKAKAETAKSPRKTSASKASSPAKTTAGSKSAATKSTTAKRGSTAASKTSASKTTAVKRTGASNATKTKATASTTSTQPAAKKATAAQATTTASSAAGKNGAASASSESAKATPKAPTETND